MTEIKTKESGNGDILNQLSKQQVKKKISSEIANLTKNMAERGKIYLELTELFEELGTNRFDVILINIDNRSSSLGFSILELYMEYHHVKIPEKKLSEILKAMGVEERGTDAK